jgi:Spy/CpxP family protein refolding chaperone
MNTIRILALTALVLSAASVQGMAQEGPPRGGGMRGLMAGPSVQDLTTRLALTPDQQAKVGKIIATWDGDTKVARETLTKNFQAMQSGGDVEALRAESMMAMQFVREKSQGMSQEIRGVLSPDQVKTYDAWLEEQAQQMRQRRQGGPPPALR